MIKTSDFVKRVKSMGINVESIYGSGDDRFFEMGFAGFKIALVAQNIMGKLNILPPFFKLDISDQRQLVELMMDYAQTPLTQREGNQWNVIIGQDTNGTNCITAYAKSEHKGFWVDGAATLEEICKTEYIFSDEEYVNLIDHLRGLKNDKRLTQIAELGKVPAPEVKRVRLAK